MYSLAAVSDTLCRLFSVRRERCLTRLPCPRGTVLALLKLELHIRLAITQFNKHHFHSPYCVTSSFQILHPIHVIDPVHTYNVDDTPGARATRTLVPSIGFAVICMICPSVSSMNRPGED